MKLLLSHIAISLSLIAAGCQPKGKEAATKAVEERAPAEAQGKEGVDLDTHGESCALAWGPPPTDVAELNLTGGQAFQYSNDFCGRVKDFQWPGGSGQLDFRVLVHLDIPMDFSYWKDVFTRANLKLDTVRMRLQLVFDGNFGPVAVRQAPAIDLVTSAAVSFTQPYNLCTSGVANVEVLDLKVATPLGELTMPDIWRTALNDATFKVGGPLHTHISKALPGWVEGWANGVLDNLRKMGCQGRLVTKQNATP